MAYVINDDIHQFAQSFIARKYVSRADDRQRSIGVSYVTAETNDLVSEVAAFARQMIEFTARQATQVDAVSA